MGNRKYIINFEFDNKFMIFKDTRNEDHYYAMRWEDITKYRELEKTYHPKSEAPPNVFIPAIKLQIINEINSNLTTVNMETEELVDFPLCFVDSVLIEWNK